MAIPGIRQIEQAILQCIADEQEYHRQDIINLLATHFDLTDEELAERIPSGAYKFANRFSTALTNLNNGFEPTRTWRSETGFVDRLGEGKWRITADGLQAMTGDWQPQLDDGTMPDFDPDSPEESIDENYQKVQEKLAADLLEKIHDNSPPFFEELVIDLLVKMGYGGSREDAGKAVGRSGDGGIDGIINEDRLGLDVIYVQAKRWEGNVGEPDIARFAGALAGRGANKGIFITTSDFTKAARAYDASGFKIILIDGNQLAQYMIEHNVGVSAEKTYEIKRVDSDYFAENAENS